ncbi:hypothetical protein BBJ28_00014732 [Nothophytophthora sp. Chile5]|nr:hypothetical protein BBJ28_00014732 [Nothophytophthora sp. Chile5]
MKAIHVTRFGTGEDNLAFVEDAPKPDLAPNSADILVKVLATSVHPGDCRVMDGSVSLVMKPKEFPYVLGMELCGVVEEVGVMCKRFKVGDRVVASLPSFEHGTFTEYVAFDSQLAVLAPKNCSSEEATSLIVSGCTAIQALKSAQVVTNGKILILGGSGGVGTFLLQLAKIRGVSTIATTSTNAQLVSSLGADQVVDYREHKWWELLAGQNFDAIIDCVGGDESWQHCDHVLSKSGRFVAVATDPEASIRSVMDLIRFAGPAMWRSLNPFTTSYTLVVSFPKEKEMQELVDMVDKHDLKPVLDPSSPYDFTLEAVQRAVALQRSQRAKGKLVVRIDDP